MTAPVATEASDPTTGDDPAIAPTGIAPPRAEWLLALTFGCALTASVSGYQFGRGNHTVYLLEPLRLADPTVLTADWFTTQTLQYHAIFAHLTGWLMRLGIERPAFAAGYVALIVAWHTAWLGWVVKLGGSSLTYAVSVLLYYLLGAGVNLGVYQFLQDGCFLPSNVSNVALFCGLYLFVSGRTIGAGAAFGLAGLFHLNFAPIAIAAWSVLSFWSWITTRLGRGGDLESTPRALKGSGGGVSLQRARTRWILGTSLAVVPCLVMLGVALRVKMQSSAEIPLDQFVELYVRFRHSHHFDPLAWPAALWISFLLPIPFAVWAYSLARYGPRRAPAGDRAWTVSARVFVVFGALQVIAFVFAGLWYVSETLVQLVLWRFCIFVKLLACIGTAWILVDSARVKRWALGTLLSCVPITVAILILSLAPISRAATAMHGGSDSYPVLDLAARAVSAHFVAAVACAALCAVPLLLFSRFRSPALDRTLAGLLGACFVLGLPGGWLGLGMTPETVEPDYLEVCHWAREHTPSEARFLVPPSETAFRLEARRAIVVNFKHVPQLSSEMLVWRDRLRAVLDVSNLGDFPRDYLQALRTLDDRYQTLPVDTLTAVARAFDARYIVVRRKAGLAAGTADTPHRVPPLPIAYQNASFLVYDRGP